jgi:hypothetical protein
VSSAGTASAPLPVRLLSMALVLSLLVGLLGLPLALAFG